jgi:hypothetical protein
MYRKWAKVYEHFPFSLYFSKYYLIKYYFEVNLDWISIIILSTKADRYVVYISNFEITV